MDKQVGTPYEFTQKLSSFGGREVSDDAPLVAIKVEKQPTGIGVRGAGREWTTLSRRISPWRLDLDHLRPQVGKQLGGVRGRDQTAALDDFQAGQCSAWIHFPNRGAPLPHSLLLLQQLPNAWARKHL